MVDNTFAPIIAIPQGTGFDLESLKDYIILSGAVQIICTRLKIELPLECYDRMAPRSALAVKNFTDLGGNITTVTRNK